jgi:hypothetical protein
LGNIIVSLDDVSVFSAPSQGNEWEVRLNSNLTPNLNVAYSL